MIARVPIIGTGVPRKDPYRPAWSAPDWSVLIPSDAAGHPLTSDCLAWTTATRVSGFTALTNDQAIAEFQYRDPKANHKLLNVVSPLGMLIPGLVSRTQNPVSRRIILATTISLGIAFMLPRRAWAGRTTVVSDNFNRADGALGANWQGGYGTHSSPVIATNRFDTSILNTEESDATYIQTLAANQWAQGSLGGWTNNANGRDLWAMLRASDNTAETWYQCTLARNDSFHSNLEKRISGTATVLASENTTIWIVADSVLYEAVGTGLTLSRNGSSLLTATDSSIAGSGRSGLGLYCITNASDGEWDDFSAGEYSASVVGGLLTLGVGN